ncbi:PGRP and LysM peptidoglycan-binding domain-containing protein [Anaerostipes sp.]|uniref:PGRP and LysM peptidoglycan-binding domain-containing protein n=1 Tax=Anaerostipes sp. TaxID=1872530 RepID=UPI0025C20D59|nr:peptidoglycan-binding protein [Anaerostipes sp.]MBS7007051.1 peptidoglycan-binding protein [Anaerostipes sp.]
MQIKISEASNAKKYIKIPLLPEELSYSSTTRFQEYEILDLGEVKLPRGRNLSTVSWEGIFPAVSRKTLSFVKKRNPEQNSPTYYVNKIQKWKENHKKLNLAISGTALKKTPVYIDEFSYHIVSMGDYNYSISFVEAADLTLNKTAKKRTSGKSTKKYKVRNNKETLRDIAKKFYGDGQKYMTIYKANKSLIDKKNASQRKKGIKTKPYQIYQGQVLTIPKASQTPKKKTSVVALQKAINKDKYAKLSVNGKLDAKTKNAMKKIVIRSGKRGEVVKFVQGKVGTAKDGICGPKTVKAIKAYQRKHSLKVDGMAGYNTLMKMVK